MRKAKSRNGENPIRVELIPAKKTWVRHITPYSSLVISVVAIALSIWSAFEARRHNKLLVKPDVVFHRAGDLAADRVGLSIRNDGLGAAQVRDMRIYLDNRLMDNWQSLAIDTKQLYREPPSWFEIYDRYVLRSGNDRDLFHIKPAHILDRDGFLRLIHERIFIIMTVCSAYDECEVVCSSRGCEAEERKRQQSFRKEK